MYNILLPIDNLSTLIKVDYCSIGESEFTKAKASYEFYITIYKLTSRSRDKRTLVVRDYRI